MLKKMFIQGTYVLNKNRDNVDSLNVFPVPDGDTGTNMSLTMESAISEIANIDNLDVSDVAKAVANGSLMGARGNSGVILSQILRGFEDGCKEKKLLTIKDFANALKLASNTAYKAVMKPIEGTILTVILEISEKAMELSNTEINLNNFFVTLINHAETTLDKTPQQLDVLKQAGVVDAGGKGLIFILKGFYNAYTGQEETVKDTEETIEGTIKKEINKIHNQFQSEEDIKYGYCTEFIIKGFKLDGSNLKKQIVDFGDSMLVVGDENIIKVHIHTNNPGLVLEKGLQIGELVDIKIDNMRNQHKNRIFTEKEDNSRKLKEYGFISVAIGEGLYNIFKDLNVDKIIQGGQTMNPSTEDIVKAINELNAKNVFILPNNSNIILAANQAKEISKKNVIIIPTKTIPQGISAMLQFDNTANVKTNEEKMIEAIESVKSIQVTYSVRDSQFDNLKINNGDILGLYEGKIVKVGNDINSLTLDIVNESIEDDIEILTIYYGEEINEEQVTELSQEFNKKYSNIDIEVYYGGQPLYYYIISME